MIADNDRGFLLADGVFETFRVEKGRPLLLGRHLARLEGACRVMELPLPPPDLRSTLESEAARFAEEAGSMRITWSRGGGPRGLLPPDKAEPTLLVTTAAAGPRQCSPVPAVVSSIRRNEGSPTSSIKALDYTSNVLARIEAQKAGASDAVMLTNGGRAACTTMANLLVFKDGRWITPGTARGGVLPGIVRGVLIEGGHVWEAEVRPEDLERYPSARCNSLVGVEPLRFENGPPPPLEAAGILTQALGRVEEQER